MNKAQFNQDLRKRLSVLPNFEIEKSISYFNEMIEDRMEEGVTEEEAVAKLGDIRFLAEKILEEEGSTVEQIGASGATVSNTPKSKSLLDIIGLPFWALWTFIYSILCFSLWLFLWIFPISLIVSGLVTLCLGLFQFSSGIQVVILTAGVGLITFGFGCLLFPLTQIFHRNLLKFYQDQKKKGN